MWFAITLLSVMIGFVVDYGERNSRSFHFFHSHLSSSYKHTGYGQALVNLALFITPPIWSTISKNVLVVDKGKNDIFIFILPKVQRCAIAKMKYAHCMIRQASSINTKYPDSAVESRNS